MHSLKYTYFLPRCVLQWHRLEWFNQTRVFLTTDTFVPVSLLCPAAACVDGVVLIAFHMAPCKSHEPLLLNPDETSIEYPDN